MRDRDFDCFIITFGRNHATLPSAPCRLQRAAAYFGLDDRALAAVRRAMPPPSEPLRLRTSAAGGMMSADEAEMSSGVSGSRLRRLILRLNEPALDADRARDLVLRLRPLRNRLARIPDEA